MKLRHMMGVFVSFALMCISPTTYGQRFVAGEADAFGTQDEYRKALLELEKLSTKDLTQLVENKKHFSAANWIGRTATLNYVCRGESQALCRIALNQGLIDNALVVRDHALRVSIAGGIFTQAEKRRLVDQVIVDDRNYRNGLPLWIVTRAKEFQAKAGR